MDRLGKDAHRWLSQWMAAASEHESEAKLISTITTLMRHLLSQRRLDRVITMTVRS